MRTRLACLALSALAAPSAEAGSCVPGFDYAMFAKDGIRVQGNSGTDSYDSTAGTYATTNACTGAGLGTNATAAGAVYIQGASTVICGDGVVGQGGSPASVIAGNGNLTGARRAQSTNLALPDITVPALASAAPFSPSSTNANTSLAPNQRYGIVSCKNGSLTLTAGTYVVQKLTLTSNCELRVGSGPITIYFTDSLEMQAGVVVNASNIPSNLVFYGGPLAQSVQVQGGANAAFAIYAPRGDCQLQGNVDVYGAIVCKTAQVQGNAKIHYDRALANLAGAGFTCPAVEVSRASPIIADIDDTTSVVQGSFEIPTTTRTAIASVADVAGFTFPYITGHLRARSAASITTTASSFSAGTVVFDAAGTIPPASPAGCTTFDGSCRHVFTTTQLPGGDGVALHPPRVALDDNTASTIGALIAPASAVPGIGATQWQTIVRAVVAGKLGGVDRSTVAVVPASPLAGSSLRPTIAYVGATDGMLHAVCASVGGATASSSNLCPRLGTELWAFLPRTQLPLVRTNTTRIDGSVRVVDAFGDFASPATGTRSFRTILTFQTGSTSAVHALDVTDPANPIVVWEATTPSTPGAFALGTGLALAAGAVLVDRGPRNLVVAETTNGGTGGTGVVATALALETGARQWQFGYAYPSPPRGSSADLPLPTGLPGGAVGVDLTRSGYVTDLVMGDLYGNLWRLDAATGASRTGAGTPLFQFSTNKHPIGALPAIYSDGNRQLAVFGSGGYADPVAATWSAGTQSLIALSLTAPGPYPLTETSSELALRESLAAGDRAFAQVLVVGTEVFLSTDATDVNLTAFGTAGDTGHVVGHHLDTGQTTTVVVRGGAGALASTGTTLYSSSSDQQQQLVAAAASTTGPGVDTMTVPRLQRRLWLRVQ